MKYSESKKRLFTRQFWKTIENRYYAIFLVAVFFIFSTIGFVSDLLNNLQFTYSQLAVSVLITGTLSAGAQTIAAGGSWTNTSTFTAAAEDSAVSPDRRISSSIPSVSSLMKSKAARPPRIFL